MTGAITHHGRYGRSRAWTAELLPYGRVLLYCNGGNLPVGSAHLTFGRLWGVPDILRDLGMDEDLAERIEAALNAGTVTE